MELGAAQRPAQGHGLPGTAADVDQTPINYNLAQLGPVRVEMVAGDLPLIFVFVVWFRGLWCQY